MGKNQIKNPIRSRLKRVWSYFMGGLCIYLVIAALGWVLKDIIPVTRTHFWTYQSFQRKADFTTYPTKLPESAHDIKYYFYEGFLADKSGYRAVFSREDYEVMKENRLASFDPDFPWEVYCYDGEVKQYVDREQLKRQRINYIDKIFPKDADDSEYYFLAYSLVEDDQLYAYHGVFCNDAACEMIEFSCHCPN